MPGSWSAGDARPGPGLAGWVAAAAASATVVVMALPAFSFAYRAPALRVALETGNALVALLIGYLVYGRFREHRRRQELLLVLALTTVAAANLVLGAVASALALPDGEEAGRWTALAIRFMGTLLLAAAALTPRTRRVGRRTVVLLGLAAAVVVAMCAAGLIWGHRLPPTVDPAIDLGDASRPLFAAHPVVLGTQAVGVALYALAAVAFTRQARSTGDELLRWVAAGCVLAAFARVHYLLFPSLYTEFVYTGDLLRLGFYVFLLIGAAREIGSYWELRARTAVLEERRRMARDLHDGLSQELAYIRARSRWLATHPGDADTVERIGSAAGRALDEARRAIAALARPVDEPLPLALQQFGDELAARHGVVIDTDLDPAVDLPPAQGEQVLRIVAEAVGNAVRHGGAGRISITLTSAPRELTVTDDGGGFDPVAARTGANGRTGGFGLTSMSERARALGGAMQVRSTPGEGTTVQVTWP